MLLPPGAAAAAAAGLLSHSPILKSTCRNSFTCTQQQQQRASATATQALRRQQPHTPNQRHAGTLCDSIYAAQLTSRLFVFEENPTPVRQRWLPHLTVPYATRQQLRVSASLSSSCLCASRSVTTCWRTSTSCSGRHRVAAVHGVVPESRAPAARHTNCPSPTVRPSLTVGPSHSLPLCHCLSLSPARTSRRRWRLTAPP